ncbi:MAG: DUF4339 domain-containing protein [Planctomycetota bacterium]
MELDFFATAIRFGRTELSLSIVMGVIAAVIAAAKGRSAIAWFFIGLVTSCIGVLVLVFLPDLNEVESDRRSRQAEYRRLRERLHQQQSRQSSFESRVLGRLDSHDLALGLDTREIAGGELPALAGEADEGPEWYFDDGGHPSGPISAAALAALHRSGAIDGHTLVWHPRFGEEWRPLGEV